MNKFKRTLLFTVAGAMAFALQGCGEEEQKHEEQKSASITLVSDFEGSEVERHQSIQFSFTVENLEESAVSYVVSTNAATIAADGKLTVSDSAEVGKEFSVYAQAGEVKSNVMAFTIKDTIPTAIELVSSTTVIREDNVVEFGVRYIPTYATVREYTLEATGENASLVQITDKKLQLKSKSSYVENIGKEVKVVATLSGDTTVKDEVTLKIGEVAASIKIKNINMIVKQSKTYTVNPELYGDEGQIVQPTLDFEYESSDSSIFTVSKFGKITPKGHGSATLTVKYGDLIETASVNVIISADSIEIDNATKASIDNGLYYSKNETYPLSIKNVSPTYSKVTNKYKFAFKLIEEGSKKVLAEGDEVATIDSDLKITFKQVGKVQMDVITDSSLNDVVVPEEYEESTTFSFNINEGVNVHSYEEMALALEDDTIDVINFVKNIDVTGENVRRSGDSYTSIKARGDKHLYGNGYKIDLSNLPLDTSMNDANGKAVAISSDFITFAPGVSKAPGENKEHEPFTVQMFDLTLYGNTDYNGYNAPVADPLDLSNMGDLVNHSALNYNLKFARTFRTGFRVGYNNDKKDFVKAGGTGETENKDFYNAYVKDFMMNNVTIRGFYFGVWASHVIGTTDNLYIYDSAEKGLLNEQSQLTMNNTKFGKIGGFAIEITLDGINNISQIGAEDHGPTAGAEYDKLPFINLKGNVECNNLNSGGDSLYLKLFNEQVQGMTGFASVPDLIENNFNALVSDLGNTKEEVDALEALWHGMLQKDSVKKQLNFFNLSFMANPDVGFILSGKDEEEQTAEYYAKFYRDDEDMATGDLEKILRAYQADKSSVEYKKHQFVSCTISIESPMHFYLGKVILQNFMFDPAYLTNK